MRRYFQRLIRILSRLQDRIYYLPLLALIASLDLFFLLIPTDWMVASSVLLKPQRWLRVCIWVGAGSAVGAWLLAYLAFHHHAWLISHIHFESGHESWWSQLRFEQKLDDYGFWALALLALSILPQQLGIVIAAIGQMSPIKIVCAIFVGRFIKYLIVAFIATKAPRLLVKLKLVSDTDAKKIQRAEQQHELEIAFRQSTDHH